MNNYGSFYQRTLAFFDKSYLLKRFAFFAYANNRQLLPLTLTLTVIASDTAK
jgi:hypothetical protein